MSDNPILTRSVIRRTRRKIHALLNPQYTGYIASVRVPISKSAALFILRRAEEHPPTYRIDGEDLIIIPQWPDD